jgi:hypothetical protein
VTSTDWRMPKPSIGDVVLFSKDLAGFSSPTVGWVMQEPGDSTISIVTFTPTGYSMVYNSCHHRDDPALKQDHGWQDLGVWDFAPSTLAMRELTVPAEVKPSGNKPAK